MPLAACLLDQEERQPAVGLAAVGIGAGQEHEDVGPGREGAPGLGAVDQPPALGPGGGGDHAGDVGPEVGLGDGNRPHDLARGQSR